MTFSIWSPRLAPTDGLETTMSVPMTLIMIIKNEQTKKFNGLVLGKKVGNPCEMHMGPTQL